MVNIAFKAAPQFFKDVLVAVHIQIRPGYTMTFLNIAKTTRIGYVGIGFSFAIPIHLVGYNRFQIRFAGAQIEIGIPVIVKVAIVGTHAKYRLCQSHHDTHIRKGAIAIIAIQSRPERIILFAIRSQHFPGKIFTAVGIS